MYVKKIEINYVSLIERHFLKYSDGTLISKV